ncbi:LysR family transcriptional regulator [Rossellomorea marisflavi]|nr:LysR family transcriptional regulator [Rossellomorea marisflavi]MDR4935451.1 LysR family transcriptional regulator [Rossellomorea marisflavi]
MDWHQINYFRTVATIQHITKAAKELAISQPALSRSIAKLEDELGVPLFDRKGRRIYLNRYGKMFLRRVEESIMQIEKGRGKYGGKPIQIMGRFPFHSCLP